MNSIKLYSVYEKVVTFLLLILRTNPVLCVMFIVTMRNRFLFILLREIIDAIKDDGDACRQLIILTALGVNLTPT